MRKSVQFQSSVSFPELVNGVHGVFKIAGTVIELSGGIVDSLLLVGGRGCIPEMIGGRGVLPEVLGWKGGVPDLFDVGGGGPELVGGRGVVHELVSGGGGVPELVDVGGVSLNWVVGEVEFLNWLVEEAVSLNCLVGEVLVQILLVGEVFCLIWLLGVKLLLSLARFGRRGGMVCKLIGKATIWGTVTELSNLGSFFSELDWSGNGLVKEDSFSEYW